MGGDGPQHTLDFGFGAFHDRAFHETTHRPHHGCRRRARRCCFLPPTHTLGPDHLNGPSYYSFLALRNFLCAFSFLSSQSRTLYPRHLVGPPILVLGLGLGGVGTPRSWSIDDQTAAANQVPFGSPGADQQGFYRLDIPDKVSDHIPHLTLSRSDTRCRPQRPSPPRSAHSTVCVFSSHSSNREYRRLQYRYT